MNIAYQVLHPSDGTRSPVFFTDSYQDLAIALNESLVEENGLSPDDMIIILLEKIVGEPQFSRAALLKVSTVISTYGVNKNGK